LPRSHPRGVRTKTDLTSRRNHHYFLCSIESIISSCMVKSTSGKSLKVGFALERFYSGRTMPGYEEMHQVDCLFQFKCHRSSCGLKPPCSSVRIPTPPISLSEIDSVCNHEIISSSSGSFFFLRRFASLEAQLTTALGASQVGSQPLSSPASARSIWTVISQVQSGAESPKFRHY
jgi:hypothetical protein